MDKALQVGAPVIGLNDSGGQRIQEGVASLMVMLKFSKEMFCLLGLFHKFQLLWDLVLEELFIVQQ